MEWNAAGMGQIIERCWTDEAFKRRLLADPAAALKSVGMALPEGMTVNVVENTPSVYTLVIPEQPSALRDDDLDGVAGGQGQEGGHLRALGNLDATGKSIHIVDVVE